MFRDCSTQLWKKPRLFNIAPFPKPPVRSLQTSFRNRASMRFNPAQPALFLMSFLMSVGGQLHGQTKSSVDGLIPASVISEAKNRQIPLNAIKLHGQEWIACVENGSQVESCIVLGKRQELSPQIGRDPLNARRLTKLRFGDRLVIDRFGHPRLECILSSNMLQQQSVISELGRLSVEPDSSLTFALASMGEAKVTVENSTRQTIDTLPRYKREGRQLVRTNDVQLVSRYMEQHAEEPFMVIVTVPSQCEPCRRFDPIVVKSLEPDHTNSLAIKTFVLEYFSFQDAQREVLGTGATFPTTLIFGPKSSSPGRHLPKLVIGLQNAATQAETNRKMEASLRRGVPHVVANGVLSPESLKMLVLSIQK